MGWNSASSLVGLPALRMEDSGISITHAIISILHSFQPANQPLPFNQPKHKLPGELCHDSYQPCTLCTFVRNRESYWEFTPISASVSINDDPHKRSIRSVPIAYRGFLVDLTAIGMDYFAFEHRRLARITKNGKSRGSKTVNLVYSHTNPTNVPTARILPVSAPSERVLRTGDIATGIVIGCQMRARPHLNLTNLPWNR